jgi:hypothetical protein
VLKTTIREAILDGVIPNNREAAMEFLLQRAAGMGLAPVTAYNVAVSARGASDNSDGQRPSAC